MNEAQRQEFLLKQNRAAQMQVREDALAMAEAKVEEVAAPVREEVIEFESLDEPVSQAPISVSQSADPFADLSIEEGEAVEGISEAEEQEIALQAPSALEAAPAPIAQSAAASSMITDVIAQASVTAPENIRQVSTPRENVIAAYQWDGSNVYGSAEQRVMSSPAEFDGFVKDYLERTQSRCPGEFAIVPDTSIDGGAMRADSYEVACVGANVSSGASLLFYNDGGTFTAVAHEAPAEALDAAIDSRNRVMNVITNSSRSAARVEPAAG